MTKSTAAFALDGLATPGGVAVDTMGNVYVTNQLTGTLTIFAAPISASSEPVVTVKLGTVPLAVVIEP